MSTTREARAARPVGRGRAARESRGRGIGGGGLRLMLGIALILLPPAARGEGALSEQALARTRSARSPLRLVETPLGITVISREEIHPSRPGLGLDEALDLVPGVLAQSARNFAQDTRISIRGFGARARFGIRGIRLLVDGFPTTLPDGQSEVDSLDLAFVDRIEVIRGPISSLYGGGGGGLVSFSTLQPTPAPRVSVSSLLGTDHLSRHSVVARGTQGGTGYLVGLATTRTSGYRDHARARQTVGLVKLERTLAGGTVVEVQAGGVWAPEAQDPGGLTRDEVAHDRTAADARARSFRTGEELDQQRLGLRLQVPLGAARELELSAYHIWRTFENRLSAGRQGKQVAYDRRVAGGSLVYTDGSGPVLWTSGLDVAGQDDLRRNYENPGGHRGALTLKQREKVRSVGSFLRAELDLDWGLGLVGGVRYDWTELVVDDRLVTPVSGDDSDRLRFHELSPRLGLRFGRSPHFQVYANYASAFRVPTTTELEPADGSGGFDPGIEPERTTGLELGVKGLLGQRLVYDLALFDLRVRNALIPSENHSGTFYHNAGEVRRRGLEAGLSILLHPGVSLRTVYSFSHFRYRDFDRVTLDAQGEPSVEQLDGNREPNTPEHLLAAELRLEHGSGLFAVLALRHLSDVMADDRNSARSPGATLSDLRMGYRWKGRGIGITPVAGLRNWSGTRFDGSTRPNAFRDRFFEPAPRREAYAGLEVSLAPREWR